MKKKILTFSLLVSMIMLFISTRISNAMTISSSGTPSTVYSGEEFEITLKLDEKVTGFGGYILYAPDEITFDEKNDKLAVNPTFSDGKMSFVFAAISGIEEDTFKIKAKAPEVTEEKTITLNTQKLDASGSQTPNGTFLDDLEIKILVKPGKRPSEEDKKELTISDTSVNLEIGQSKTITATGNGTLTWTSSNESVATVENGKITAIAAGETTITVKDEAGNTKEIKVVVKNAQSSETGTENGTENGTKTGTKTGTETQQQQSSAAPTELAKTGESEVLAIGICGLILLAVIIGIRFKKMNKLFVMLPILVGLTVAGNTSDAVSISDNNSVVKNGVEIQKSDENFAYAGIIKDASILGSDVKAIGISANVGYRSELNFTEEDLNSVLEELGFDEDATYEAKNNSYLASGDKLKTGNSESYMIILYGDSNGDGRICTGSDYYVIINEFVHNIKSSDLEKIATDVNLDGNLSVRDISRLLWKFNGKDGGGDNPDLLNGTLVAADPFGPVQESEEGVAKIGTTTYPTIQEAVDAAKSNDKIVLLKDVTYDEDDITSIPSEIPEASTEYEPGISIDKDLTLDLAGHKIIIATIVENFIEVEGTVQIENSASEKAYISVDEDKTTSDGRFKMFYVGESGDLIIGENIQLDASAKVIYLSGDNSYVEINGADLTSDGGMAIYSAASDAQVKFNDGSVEMDPYNGLEIFEGGCVTIKKGTFQSYGSAPLKGINALIIGDIDDPLNKETPKFTISKSTRYDEGKSVDYVIDQAESLEFYGGQFRFENSNDVTQENLFRLVKKTTLAPNSKFIVEKDGDYSLLYLKENEEND